MEQLKEELQKVMAERFDTEFSQTWGFILKAYSSGVEDGRTSAKQDMIKMLQGEDK